MPLSTTHTQALVATGSPRVSAALADTPFPSADALVAAAATAWWTAPVTDWLAAFASHPRIASTRDVSALAPEEQAQSSREQATAAGAGDGVKQVWVFVCVCDRK